MRQVQTVKSNIGRDGFVGEGFLFQKYMAISFLRWVFTLRAVMKTYYFCPASRPHDNMGLNIGARASQERPRTD